MRHVVAVTLVAVCGLAQSYAADPPSPASLPTPSTAPTPPSSTPETHELGGVTVKGKRDPLAEADARMKKLKESLPDLQSDAPKKEGLAQRVVDRTKNYLTSHQDPNKLKESSKTQYQHIQAQGSVDREHEGSKPAVAQPDASDYIDPLCQTGSCPP